MEKNKILAYCENQYADSLCLIQHESTKAPYGIHAPTYGDKHVRYVVVYRGYWEDFSDHGPNWELAFDDFTPAYNAFKDNLGKFKTVNLCSQFGLYSALYDDADGPRSRSASAGDYSPACPWKAPGMSASDFI